MSKTYNAPTSIVTRASDKFMLRFPDQMRSRIADAAKANGRSMNAEIVHRLAQSLEATKTGTEPTLISQSFSVDLTEKNGPRVWAERLSKPGNRQELEQLLATVQALINLTK